MAGNTEQIPVFLLTGFLGAGKTTLLNRILENPGFHDTALIINEFGLVPVDHHLVREGNEQPVVTTTGCICCTVGSDLRSSLDQLLVGRRDGSLPPFSRVIVETTGLADPAPIINSLIPGGMSAMSLRDHAVARAFRLSGVITVVDVEGVGAALDSHPESLRQIAFADHVVLTKTDVAPAGDWPDRLRCLNPGLRFHDGADPAFRPSALLEPGSYSAFGKGEGVEDWLAAEAKHDHAHGHGGHFHDLNRHGNVVAIPLTRDDPVDELALRQFLVRLTSTPGNGLLRIKGLVALQDDPASPALIHAVRHRLYPITRLEGWPHGVAQSRLVVIGTALNEGTIRAGFEALSGKPQPFLAMAFQTFRQEGRPLG
ncbi:CobW family GTP-binding protein [Paracoccus sp. (in: a-proteobacteria)]|uniref:CobW family GTP-binding protein n=1 Tax=Paracoccus sp. TaxID=267 RepID=UPI003A84FC20